jgi:hypothetical protein
MSALSVHTMEEQSHRTWGNLLQDEAYRSLHQPAARGPYQLQRGTTRGSGRTNNLKHIILCTDITKIQARNVVYAALSCAFLNYCDFCKYV